MHSLTLKLADTTELAGREVPEVAGAKPAENVHHTGLKKDAGLGVHKVEDGGRSPPADPVERALKRGGPLRGGEGQHVLLDGERFDSVVLSAVGHDLVDQQVEVVVVLLRGWWSWGLA